jgi:hypothetical protein
MIRRGLTPASSEISRDELRDRIDELTVVDARPRAAFRRCTSRTP